MGLLSIYVQSGQVSYLALSSSRIRRFRRSLLECYTNLMSDYLIIAMLENVEMFLLLDNNDFSYI